MFKDKFPDVAIGFSKFACLRPRYCILAGASGTHSVCVCTFHQNVKLMMLTASESVFLQMYHYCIAQVICNPPSCSACPGIGVFKTILTALLDNSMIDNVTYKQWINVDRSMLDNKQHIWWICFALHCHTTSIFLQWVQMYSETWRAIGSCWFICSPGCSIGISLE